MRVHLYTNWFQIEKFRNGEVFTAWNKKRKSDIDIHIDIDINYYNFDIIDADLYSIRKKNPSEIFTANINSFGFK